MKQEIKYKNNNRNKKDNHKIINKNTFNLKHKNNNQQIIQQQIIQKQQLQLPIIKINGENQKIFSKNKLSQKSLVSIKRSKSNIDQYQNEQYNIGKDIIKLQRNKKLIKKSINNHIMNKNIKRNHQSIHKLFIHALKNISNNQNFIHQKQKQDSINHNFPSQILDIFYRQNIDNYNPYIECMDKLVSFKDKLSKQSIQKIQKLCFIGIAKNYLKSQKYTSSPKYRKVNILIRTYMYDIMKNIIEQKSQNYQNIIFIPCNKDALSFTPNNFPQQLNSICSQQFFQKAIRKINKIIQQQYIAYKRINVKQTVNNNWSQNFFYFITIICIIIFLITKRVLFIYIIAMLILISIFMYLLECRQTLSMLRSSKDIIRNIQTKIQLYLKQMNNYSMQWRVGEDFYWLEIHYICKKKKKNPEGNQNQQK